MLNQIKINNFIASFSQRFSIGLEYLTNLREFRLSETTQINKFPLKMKNWMKLEVFELNHLSIEMIPSEVWMMAKLRHLSLSDNKLSFISSELWIKLSHISRHHSCNESMNE
jgi:Leucine-rich repeat (LRR) protein